MKKIELEKQLESYYEDCEFRKRLNEKTIKAYTIDLNQYLEFITTTEINQKIINEYIHYLNKKYLKYKTIKRKIASVKAFYSYLEYEEIIDYSPFNKIKTKIKEPKLLPKTIQKDYIDKIIHLLLKDLKNSKTEFQKKISLRNITLISVMFSTGIRVSELCNIKLKDITPFYWQKFLLFLAQTQPQKSIINNSFYPKHILKTAYKLKLISTNPTKDIALPKSSIKKIVSTEDLYFNQEELSHILKVVKSYKSSPYMYYICFLMSYTGMRLGELSALRWSDIDYKNKTIIINSTMYSKNKNIWLRQDTPKTLSSIRTISIGDDTISVLKEWHVYQLSNRLLNKTMNNYPKDDFVFTKYYAKENKELPILPTSIKSTFTRMRIKFNIPKLHSHIFRHTHVSLLSEAGISLEIIQNRLGHKDNNTTQKIYLHITKKSKINAAITFEKYMSKNGNKMATN